MVPFTFNRALLHGLLVGLLIGSLIGVGVANGSIPGSPAADQPDREPGLTYSRAGPSCFDGPGPNDGWIFVIANGRTWLVSANLTILHPPETEVTVDLTEHPSGVWDIEFQTVPTTAQKPPSETDCPQSTTFDLSTGLPEPNLEISVNGRTVRRVTQDETVGNLYPLPSVVNATG